MNKSILSLLLLLSFSAVEAQMPEAPKVDSIRYVTFQTDGGWGYDIYINGNVMIHQPTIPAIVVFKPFSAEKDAVKTAKLVVKKIKKGLWPPAVTLKELKKMKVPEARKKWPH